MYKQVRCLHMFLLFIFVFAAALIMGCSDSGGPSSKKDLSESGIAKVFKDRTDKGGTTKNSENHTDESRTTRTEFLVPSADGIVVYGNDVVSIDASNTSEGYVMVQYIGNVSKVKIQITAPDGTVYSYNLRIGNYETFALSKGSGDYGITVLEHVQDDMYAVSFSTSISVSISDEFKPFLYPNQYVWFTPESKAVGLGKRVSDGSSNDLDYVEQIYRYIIENITYDDELAANIQPGYLPVIDNTLDTGKGICFDYASLMAALLRSQGIPTKLEIGYSGDAYHAWISVYLKEIGWVNGIIKFDGVSWSLMDPTLAANNSNSSVEKYIGDGNNYTVKYSY